MDHDTPGSNLIKNLLLDDDPRPLYLQAWGGTNTIARALKSIENQYVGTAQWPDIKAKVTKKAVILASGFQDQTYADYLAPSWPLLKVEQLSAGYATWGYNCNFGNTGTSVGCPPTVSTSKGRGACGWWKSKVRTRRVRLGSGASGRTGAWPSSGSDPRSSRRRRDGTAVVDY